MNKCCIICTWTWSYIYIDTQHQNMVSEPYKWTVRSQIYINILWGRCIASLTKRFPKSLINSYTLYYHGSIWCANAWTGIVWICCNTKKFRGHADLMFSGPLKDKDDSAKVSYLLLWMGEKGRDIYRTLVLTKEQRKSVNDICEAIERHVQPKSNPVFSRYKFYNEKQGERTTEAFIKRLKTLSVECAYGPNYHDDLICD